MKNLIPQSILAFMICISLSLTISAQAIREDIDTTIYSIRIDKDKRITLSPLPSNSTGLVSLAGQFDLNSDGMNELLICLGVRDTSIYVSAIYSPDTKGNYRCILKPNYWGKIEVGTSQSDGWSNLVVYNCAYFKTIAIQENGLLLDFIEPAPASYIFNLYSFVKKEHDLEGRIYISDRNILGKNPGEQF